MFKKSILCCALTCAILGTSSQSVESTPPDSCKRVFNVIHVIQCPHTPFRTGKCEIDDECNGSSKYAVCLQHFLRALGLNGKKEEHDKQEEHDKLAKGLSEVVSKNPNLEILNLLFMVNPDGQYGWSKPGWSKLRDEESRQKESPFLQLLQNYSDLVEFDETFGIEDTSTDQQDLKSEVAELCETDDILTDQQDPRSDVAEFCETDDIPTDQQDPKSGNKELIQETLRKRSKTLITLIKKIIGFGDSEMNQNATKINPKSKAEAVLKEIENCRKGSPFLCALKFDLQNIAIAGYYAETIKPIDARIKIKAIDARIKAIEETRRLRKKIENIENIEKVEELCSLTSGMVPVHRGLPGVDDNWTQELMKGVDALNNKVLKKILVGKWAFDSIFAEKGLEAAKKCISDNKNFLNHDSADSFTAHELLKRMLDGGSKFQH